MCALDHEDYGDRGLTIREALLDQVKRFPNKAERPQHILWSGLPIATADIVPILTKGTIRAEFLSWKEGVEQGFDIKLDGWLQLANGEKVSLLRTWNHSKYDPAVEYPFHSNAGRLWVWNVYKRRLPDGRAVEEKWTENAGLWVQKLSANERVYHCSHGFAYPPDFESLVFRVTIKP